MRTDSNNKKLNKQQLEAIQHGKGPLLIIAGAGTGKTTVITERIKWLISKGFAKPSQILALTFTQKAAREMEERVDILMPYGYTQMWISTFHAFCERILRQEAVHIGLDPGFKLLSDTDATMLLRKNIFKMDLDYFRPLGNPTKFIQGMITHFSRLHDEDISSKEYLLWVQSTRGGKTKEEKLESKKYLELANAYKFYQELKVIEGLMDYGDLIGNTLKIFRQRKNILKEYQEQFKFILVDEFQDTNIAQNELLLLLSQKNKNITAVADDNQSIYKFRGAAISNVMSFRKHFPKAKLVVLTQNYRSTQEILDKSYQLIQHNNPDTLEVKEGINKKLQSKKKDPGEKMKLIYVDRVENEADEVAKEIKNLIGSDLNKERSDPLSWKDFAILLRANNHAEPFVRSFLRHGIPFQFLGPGQLFRQPEVKDLIAYLQVLQDFTNSVALFRVLSMSYFDIDNRDLTAVSNFSRKYNLSLFEGCEVILGLQEFENGKLPNIKKESKDKIKKIILMITKHLKLISKETAGQILYYFLEDTGMIKNILDFKFPLDEKKANNISKFFSKLKTYEVEHEDARVETVLDWIMLSMEMGESPQASDTDWAENDAVNILTVHSAKGLEFKVVFMGNLVSQRFPTVEKREQIPIPDKLIKEELPVGDYHEQEERRLFYVGMTRAKERLYFTAAKYYGEGKRDKRISPFVYEAIGEEAIINEDKSNESQLSIVDWKKDLPAGRQEKLPVKPLQISYISYSQIDAFKLCPLHYKLRYILKIEPPIFPAASFGISVHNALKDLYLLLKRGEKGSKEKLIDLLKKNWVREGYTTKAYENAMFVRGRKYLSDYFKKEFDPKTKTIVLEQPFTATIAAGKKILRIGGKIDRMDDLGSGKVEIIDYKTGRVPSQRQVNTDLQLSIYAIAVTQIREPPFQRKPEDVILSMYFFDSQEKITTVRTHEQIQEDKKKIFEWIEKIEHSDFKCSGNVICSSCEYRMFCNVYNME
ncbi:ATP-dependent helicase [Candidatus Gottesmanbacteria bacterium]|nr:ATP-dependent helicase [Candidatus Gottesmanbacteria bacterium]